MKRNLLLFLLGLVFVLIFLTSCKSSQIGTLNKTIPTNTSTNNAWGGGMCEADGMVYYISNSYENNILKYHIMRMNPNGSEQTQVTNDYPYIKNLISDKNNIYFTTDITSRNTNANTIFRMSIVGGKVCKVVEGNINGLQHANGKLYWTDYPLPDSNELKGNQKRTITIKCINPDGSDLKIIFRKEVPCDGYKFDFLATDKELYFYSQGSDYVHCNIYRMDFDGNDIVKLNKKEINKIDKLFYDKGNLYLILNANDLVLSDSVDILDSTGEAKTIIKSIGYYPQDFGMVQYCGVSDNIFYYFKIDPGADSSKQVLNLHQYNFIDKMDSVVKYNVDMSGNAVGTLHSILGKSIPCGGVTGLYIVGNDIYYEPFNLP